MCDRGFGALRQTLDEARRTVEQKARPVREERRGAGSLGIRRSAARAATRNWSSPPAEMSPRSEKPRPERSRRPGMNDLRASERARELRSDRRSDRPGTECSRNKKNVALGDGDGRRRRRARRNDRNPRSRPRDRPRGTKRRRPCCAGRESKPRGPRSIRGRLPSARTRTYPFVTWNPRTLRRVKVGRRGPAKRPFCRCRSETWPRARPGAPSTEGRGTSLPAAAEGHQIRKFRLSALSDVCQSGGTGLRWSELFVRRPERGGRAMKRHSSRTTRGSGFPGFYGRSRRRNGRRSTSRPGRRFVTTSRPRQSGFCDALPAPNSVWRMRPAQMTAILRSP